MPIQFLWGDEDFLIERTINKIKKEILGEDINPLNFKTVDNPSFPLFCELLRTNAMMFGDVLIVVKCQKYFLETKNKEKLDDKQTAELINALNNTSDRVHFVFVCLTPRGEKKKPDSRKKLYKEILKLTKPIEFPSYRSYEEYKLIPVIKNLASEISLKINQSEISKLIQTTGSSLRDIFSQLEKLKLYAYPNDTVTKEMIEEIACFNIDIFKLIDLIVLKNYTEALGLINEILQKEHFLPSLAFIQTSVTNLLKTKLYHKKMSSFDLAVKLNQNEFVVKKNIQKVINIPLDELIRLKINLSHAEYCLKTGKIKEPLSAYELAFLKEDMC